MISTSHPLLTSKSILAILLLILLSIAHLYYDFYKVRIMNQEGSPLSESFPKELQLMNSSDLSTSSTSSSFTKSFSEIVIIKQNKYLLPCRLKQLGQP